MSQPIFTNWTAQNAADWGHKPLCLSHRLHQSPLFSPEALADLIERFPAEHYALVRTGQRGDSKKLWREGTIGNLKGAEVMQAIAAGGMWLNMRNVMAVDTRYKVLVDEVFDELAGYMPNFQTFSRGLGILISSPNAQVYYHCDLPGQSLWQIMGRKRVFVYPAAEPFLPQDELEKIALYGVEVDMRYDPSYEPGAAVFDFEPGQMLTWPLNAPHRVENLDSLNVSVTTEHWTNDIRRSQMVTVGNGILRNHFGMTPHSRAIAGPGFMAKAALQAGWRRSPWFRRERRKRRPISFTLQRDTPGYFVDLPVAA